MNSVLYVGIDPGASGGWAALWGDGKIHHVGKLKDTATFILACRAPLDMYIMLEKVWATPQMGVTSSFSFGYSFGWLAGVIDACGRGYQEVTSMKWQRELGLIQSGRKLGRGTTAKKNANKAKAEELFPGQRITHATADALLIAEYCRRVYSA